MIDISVNVAYMEHIQNRLGHLQSEAAKVLAKAVNATAKQARKELSKEAKQTYTVKVGNFNKNMKIKNATKSKPVAIITSKGKSMALSNFKINPTGPMKNGVGAAKAKVIKANGLKQLVLSGAERSGKDLKAFVTKFASGHVAIVQRIPGSRMRSSPHKEALKEFYSTSIPKMIGDEKRVYGKVKPIIKDNLKQRVDVQISRVLRSV